VHIGVVVAAISWQTTLIAVATSGLVSALVTTALSGRHERSQQMRERMLAAADEFLKAARAGIRGLDEISPFAPMPEERAAELPPQPGLSEEELAQAEKATAEKRKAEAEEAKRLDPRTLSERYAAMRTQLEACEDKLGPVLLLFHPASGAAIAASLITASLRYGASTAERYRDPPPDLSTDVALQEYSEQMRRYADAFKNSRENAEYGEKKFVEGAWERLARPITVRPPLKKRLNARWIALQRRIGI
jgi:hypothetical protein